MPAGALESFDTDQRASGHAVTISHTPYATMNKRLGRPRNRSGPSGFGGFPGPTSAMIVIMATRLAQTTAVSINNGSVA